VLNNNNNNKNNSNTHNHLKQREMVRESAVSGGGVAIEYEDDEAHDKYVKAR